MKVNVELLPQPYLLNIIEDDVEYIKKNKDELWQDFKKENPAAILKNVPGFRSDNVPRSLGEKKFDQKNLYEKLLNQILSRGIKESKLSVVSVNASDAEIRDNDAGIVILAEVNIQPTVDLKRYKGLEVKYEEPEIKETEIDAVLQRARESHATKETVTGRTVAEKDIVKIEYVGVIDGIEFEGGSTKRNGIHVPQSLEVGSNQFIPGFEVQLIGMNVSETKQIKVVFPKNYVKQELRNKEATFEVTIREISIKKLPDINDTFVQELGYQSVLDARNKLRDDLIANKKHQSEAVLENALMDELDKNNTVSPIPRAQLNQQLDWEFSRLLKQLNMTEEAYYKRTRGSRSDFDRQYTAAILRQLRIQHILAEIANTEKVEATKEEIEARLQREAIARKVSIESLRGNQTLIDRTIDLFKMEKVVGLVKQMATIETKTELKEAKVTEIDLKDKK